MSMQQSTGDELLDLIESVRNDPDISNSGTITGWLEWLSEEHKRMTASVAAIRRLAEEAQSNASLQGLDTESRYSVLAILKNREATLRQVVSLLPD